jgi:hypothetical protein
MTTTDSHKADLRMQLRIAISATRKQLGRRPPPNNLGGKLTEWRKTWERLEDQIRMLDVIEALKEGDPLPLGWQDIRLPD